MAALAISQCVSHVARPASPTTMTTKPSGSRQEQFFRSALILRKSTRWQWEKDQTGLNDVELKKYLQSKGVNVQELLENEKKQVNAVQEIVNELTKAGISTRVVTRDQLQQYLPETDLVISAGGDGTFLTAASAVNDQTPVVGINTDPIGSEGHLCVGGKNPPRNLIELLVSGKLKWVQRSRIRVTVKESSKYSSIFSLTKRAKKTAITNLALNEVFIGEDEAAKVSTYNISIDDSSMVKQKSSGMIVTTGTGSTSWYLSMNAIDENAATSVIEALQSLGFNVPVNRNIVSKVVSTVNDKIPFEPDHPSFAFSIREPIFNGTYKRTATRGFARKIKLESRCTNGYLVLDGATKIPFPRGAVATIEISGNHALKTVIV
uniref:NAD(+) kinase n=1 Tax=Caenorhabditis japonica TaxID=281687 RepID=A0A8R1E546_CAEJA